MNFEKQNVLSHKIRQPKNKNLIHENQRELHFIKPDKSLKKKILATYVKTTLSLHFINLSEFPLSEFIHRKKGITHNNSLLILKEASCVCKNIKQLFGDEGSL